MKTQNKSASKSTVPKEGLYPEIIKPSYKGSGKLKNKKALITGGDSGIGQSVAVHFAREGAEVAIVYHTNIKDAKETQKLVEREGRTCILLKGDITKKSFRNKVLQHLKKEWGNIDVLVNNAGIQFPKDKIEQISDEQILKTFDTNILSMISFTRDTLALMKNGSRIICTTSVTSYRGSDHLIDYSATKGAITTFIRSMAVNLADQKILVNGVAPGPIWTPLVKETFDDLKEFGKKTALKRGGQPSECGPAYVFLASEDSSYITGEVLHINGGDFVGG